MRIFKLYLSFCLSFLLLVGCEKNTSKLPKKLDDVLHVAVSSDYPPFVYDQAGKLVGFEVELIQAVAVKLGKTVQFHDVDFQNILDVVAKKQVDCAVASIAQTPERAKKVAFTLPYHRSMSVIVVPYAAAVNTISDLKGKTLGIESGTTYQQYFNAKKRSLLKGIKQINRNKFMDLFEAMRDGKCQAILTGYSEGYAIQDINPDLKIIPIEDTITTFAIALPKNSPLLEKINTILQEMARNGDTSKLEQQYFKKIVTKKAE